MIRCFCAAIRSRRCERNKRHGYIHFLSSGGESKSLHWVETSVPTLPTHLRPPSRELQGDSEIPHPRRNRWRRYLRPEGWRFFTDRKRTKLRITAADAPWGRIAFGESRGRECCPNFRLVVPSFSRIPHGEFSGSIKGAQPDETSIALTYD